MRTAALIAALAVVVPTTHALERARYLMGTVCEVAVTGEQATPAEAQIEAAFAEAKRVEQMLSTWIADSELSRVNRGAATPGEELRGLLELTAEWTKKTNGTFDPRYARKGHDPGAWGKGYALDRMLALTAGDAVIDFGGQLIVRGAHEVAIADPEDRGKPVFALTIENASLSTSSGSEKPGHIVDPRTGQSLPARGSASAIADDAMTADILSTALYVMGADEGLRWADDHGIAAIFITPEHDIRLSAKARERTRGLSLLDHNFSLKD